jgi:hypothetical protein
MLFLYLLLFICQYLYINYIFDKKNPNVVKSGYTYTLQDKIEQSATIYRTNRNVKKVILFCSGAYSIEYHFYISKLMYDLDVEYESLMTNYELICYEKTDKTSFDIYDDVHNYILHLDKELLLKNGGKIEELILIGFSAGGVVASHVMSRCKSMTCKKKIITYDTPWQVHENVDSFKNNMIYRFDILFFSKVHDVYSNHYNYNLIKHHLTNKKWNYGSDEITKLIKDVHNCSHEEFYRMTGFNFDQTEDTKVYNIYSRKDIFAIREISDNFVDKNKDKIKFYNKNIEKNTIGHCSDMAFSKDYLMDIMISIKF